LLLDAAGAAKGVGAVLPELLKEDERSACPDGQISDSLSSPFDKNIPVHF
jgi:hypothetical protein